MLSPETNLCPVLKIAIAPDCFMFPKRCTVGDLFPMHVASHLFMRLHTICFSVGRFQVLLTPHLPSHRKQFKRDRDFNHLDSHGVGNPSCPSFVFGKCFNGVSKLCSYEVLMGRQHLFLQWQMMLTVSLWVFNSTAEVSLMLQEPAPVDNQVPPQILSIPFISDVNRDTYQDVVGSIHSGE